MKRVKVTFVWLLSLLMIAFISCKKDDNGGNTPLVEDGIYLVGDATNYVDLNSALLMTSATNEAATNAAREGMYEIYTTLESGKTFYIAEVAGITTTKYGPSAVDGEFFSYNPKGHGDQVKVTIQLGKYIAGSTTFSVPTSDLYHIVIDKQLGKIAIIPIDHWAVIGDATPGSWSDESPMTLDGSFNKTTMTFKVTDLVIRKGGYKFRHSGGWKVQLDDTTTTPSTASTVKVNTNFGGTFAALVAGGDNMTLALADEGKYTAQATWTQASGYNFSITKTGTVEPLATYPDSMYVVGGATAIGWPVSGPGENKNAAMHNVPGGASFEGIYWKILFLKGGEGFKISNKNWGNVNLGFADVTSYDADGVTVTENGTSGNMQVAADGMYIVVLNLQNDEKHVSIKPAEVYAIGDAWGGFNTALAANKFTIDLTAKTLVSPAATAAGNLRSYAFHSWLGAIGDWWHSEFILSGSDIVYRNNGGDPAAAPLTIGQKVTYHFDDNTGSIGTK